MAHPKFKNCRRRAVLVGWALVGIGLLLSLLPIGPGIVIVLVGLSILSIYSPWARRKAAYAKKKYPRASHRVEQIAGTLKSFFALLAHEEAKEHEVVLGGKKYSLLVDASRIAGGTAVLLHSATGVKETPLMESLAEAARQAGQNVVRFDAFNSFGKSGGSVHDMTVSSYIEDQREVLAWARKQDWWSEPLTLIGHSVGGLVALLHAVRSDSHSVERLVLVAPMTSGESYAHIGSEHDPELFHGWHEKGIRDVTHQLTGEKGTLSWNFVEDAKRYDALREPALPCPTLLLVGSEDTVAPLADVSRLLLHARADITLKVIDGALHTPTDKAQLLDIEKTVVSWLDKHTP